MSDSTKDALALLAFSIFFGTFGFALGYVTAQSNYKEYRCNELGGIYQNDTCWQATKLELK